MSKLLDKPGVIKIVEYFKKKIKTDIEAAKVLIVDNLSTISSDKALSAGQGKVLDDKIKNNKGEIALRAYENNVYNKAYLDVKFGEKANNSEVYTRSKIDLELAKKADKDSVYTKDLVWSKSESYPKTELYNKTEIDAKTQPQTLSLVGDKLTILNGNTITLPTTSSTTPTPTTNTEMYKKVYLDAVNGLDTNDGTEAKPLKTLKKAIESVPVRGMVDIYINQVGANYLEITEDIELKGRVVSLNPKTKGGIYGIDMKWIDSSYIPTKQRLAHIIVNNGGILNTEGANFAVTEDATKPISVEELGLISIGDGTLKLIGSVLAGKTTIKRIFHLRYHSHANISMGQNSQIMSFANDAKIGALSLSTLDYVGVNGGDNINGIPLTRNSFAGLRVDSNGSITNLKYLLPTIL